MLDKRNDHFFTKRHLRSGFISWRRQPMIRYFQEGLPEPVTPLGRALQHLDDAYQNFIVNRVDPLLGSKRHALNQELAVSVGHKAISPVDKALNRRVAYALIFATSGLLANLSPLFLLIGLPFSFMIMFNLTVLIRDRHQRGLPIISYPLVILTGWVLGTISGQFAAIGILGLLTNMSYKTKTIVEDHAHNRLINQFSELPQKAWRLHEGVETQTPLDELVVGDVIVVGGGEVIPVDGVLTEGDGAVDQHMLTGESQPVEKSPGDEVFASTIVISGKLYIQVQKTGAATVSAQIVAILNNAYDYHKMMESKGYEISNTTAPYILAATAAATFMLGPAYGTGITFVPMGYTARASAPLAMLNFLNLAADRNILIKDARSLELLSEVDTFLFDKTGTLTQEQPQVGRVQAFNGYENNAVLSIAAAAEERQAHPIARAILEAAQERGLALPEVGDPDYEMGFGLRVIYQDQAVRVGSERFMTRTGIAIPDEARPMQAAAHERGASLVFVSVGEVLAGALEIVPVFRPEAPALIAFLHERGYEVAIISGDHEGPTRRLAQLLGIDRYYANTLPENKASLVEQLQAEGRRVCFVGDGINDGIALKKAEVSISMQGSTNVALDVAQVILMDRTLQQLPYLVDLSKRFERNINLGIKWALYPGIAVMGGVFAFGWTFSVVSIAATGVLVVGLSLSMMPVIRDRWLSRGGTQELPAGEADASPAPPASDG